MKPSFMKVFQKVLTVVATLQVLSSASCTRGKNGESSAEVPEVFAEEAKFSERALTRWFYGEMLPGVFYPHVAEIEGRVVKWMLSPGAKVQKGQAIVMVKPWSSALTDRNFTIFAEVSGFLSSRKVAVGEAVKVGQTLTEIWDGAKRVITWRVQKKDLNLLNLGDHVAVYAEDPAFSESVRLLQENPETNGAVDSVENEKTPAVVQATVDGLSPIEDDTLGGHQITATADCSMQKEACDRLPLRSWVKLEFRAKVRKLIEVSSDLINPMKPELFVLKGEAKDNHNEVELRSLTLGEESSGQVEVLSGLIPGDRYVSSFSQKPEAGKLVRVVEKDADAKASETKAKMDSPKELVKEPAKQEETPDQSDKKKAESSSKKTNG